MVNLTDADICNVIRAERKAATDAEREELGRWKEEHDKLKSALMRIVERPKDLPLRTRNDYEAGEKFGVEWCADIAADALGIER